MEYLDELISEILVIGQTLIKPNLLVVVEPLENELNR